MSNKIISFPNDRIVIPEYSSDIIRKKLIVLYREINYKYKKYINSMNDDSIYLKNNFDLIIKKALNNNWLSMSNIDKYLHNLINLTSNNEILRLNLVLVYTYLVDVNINELANKNVLFNSNENLFVITVSFLQAKVSPDDYAFNSLIFFNKKMQEKLNLIENDILSKEEKMIDIINTINEFAISSTAEMYIFEEYNLIKQNRFLFQSPILNLEYIFYTIFTKINYFNETEYFPQEEISYLQSILELNNLSSEKLDNFYKKMRYLDNNIPNLTEKIHKMIETIKNYCLLENKLLKSNRK